MKELTCPTVQFCFGNSINSQNSSNILLNNLKDRPNINSMPSLINALTQSEQTIMEHNYYLQNRKQQIQQNNRSPSVSGNFSIGLTTTTINNNKGRRLSERLINENNNGIIKGRLERSNSVLSSRNGNTNLNFIPELTPQQVSNLRRSWKHINTKGLYDVIRRAFSKLESSAPNVRSAFKNNYLDNQQQKNIGGISKCGGIECELRLIGARHVPCYEYFNLNVTQLEQLGEALAEQFFKLDGIRQSKETTKVWRTLIAHIIDYIRDGFETELRLKRRKRTTNALLGNCGDAAGVVVGPPTVEMALAPFESKFLKRNSMPGLKRQSSSITSNTLTTASTSTKTTNKKEKNGPFFKTELTNITKKLCNM
uniref:Globin domain-containing protein n=1 Tax=Meloidogyne enterolobii TaxID=390850 RepID=A0A6V7Y323_MELEN|nr:unnamed protein product [Meloidogyne enterolobii]